MATRKGSEHINDLVIGQLHKNILAGVPWRPPQAPGEELAYGDLIYLTSGHHYGSIACNFILQPDDIAMAVNLWSDLRELVIAGHVKHHSASRPWAWWGLEDREPLRRLDSDPCTCPPAIVHHGLPPPHLSWFGRRRGCRCEVEDESAYLARLCLLMPEERRAAAKSP